jgi:sphingolipid delta-4 desaturase
LPPVSTGTLDFDVVDYPEPHLARTRQLLKDHPEVKKLFGPARVSALLTVSLVGLQIGGSLLCSHVGLGWTLLLAYTLGAAANHALWVLIHECTHNLVFRSSRANSLLQILANGPIVFPAAISFRKFHLLHHRFQGDPELDADLASEAEARFVGNSSWRKALWMLTFFAWQAARVRHLKRVQFWDAWYVLNLAYQLCFVAFIYAVSGLHGVLYVTLASIFAIGLHPLGARWIQEHYLTSKEQETYSYYGPLNVIALNVGYHNEHHDLMRVPWLRLPEVKRAAPELYEPLQAHRSWTRLWLRFLFDPSLSLYSRRIRRRKEPQTDVLAAVDPGPAEGTRAA